MTTDMPASLEGCWTGTPYYLHGSCCALRCRRNCATMSEFSHRLQTCKPQDCYSGALRDHRTPWSVRKVLSDATRGPRLSKDWATAGAAPAKCETAVKSWRMCAAVDGKGKTHNSSIRHPLLRMTGKCATSDTLKRGTLRPFLTVCALPHRCIAQ